MRKIAIIGILGMILSTAAAMDLVVGRFSSGDLQDWKNKEFTGETRYQLVQEGEKKVLRADSQGTASGLYREITVNLKDTPYLNWSWRVDNVLKNIDERSKSGDDYPARVYLVISGGAFFWKTKSLVYVWSSHQPIDNTWNNAYTDNARVIALRSGTQESKQWIQEKRNIRKDFKRLFGDDIDHIDAVAIMTDTDNSGQKATAWYGDIYFSRD